MLPRSAGLSSGIVIGILLVILVSGVLNSTLGPNITYRASLSYSNGVVTERISGDSRYAAQLARADYLIC